MISCFFLGVKQCHKHKYIDGRYPQCVIPLLEFGGMPAYHPYVYIDGQSPKFSSVREDSGTCRAITPTYKMIGAIAILLVTGRIWEHAGPSPQHIIIPSSSPHHPTICRLSNLFILIWTCSHPTVIQPTRLYRASSHNHPC